MRHALLLNPNKIGERYEIKIFGTSVPEERDVYHRAMRSGWTLVGWVDSEMSRSEIAKGLTARETDRRERAESKLALIHDFSKETI